VLIVAARYGSVDAAGVSFTEQEYHYAVSQKKTVLAFIHNDLGNIPANKTDMDQELQQIGCVQERNRKRPSCPALDNKGRT
jgi:hypothetical protein